LPIGRDTLDAPIAQRIALLRILDLDDLGAEIGELQAQHVAGDEPRQVDDPDPVERPQGIGRKSFHYRVLRWLRWRRHEERDETGAVPCITSFRFSCMPPPGHASGW